MSLNTNIFSVLEKYSSGTSEIQTTENYVNNVLCYLLTKSRSLERSLLNMVFNGNIPIELQKEHTIYSQYTQGNDIYDLAFLDGKSCISLVIELKVGSKVLNEQLRGYQTNTKADVIVISLEDPKYLIFKNKSIRAFHWDDVDKATKDALIDENDPTSNNLLKEFREFLLAHGLQKPQLISIPRADINALETVCNNVKEAIPYKTSTSGRKADSTHRGYNIYTKKHKNKVDKCWGISFVYSIKPTTTVPTLAE